MIIHKDVPCVMKLTHYLRYYERTHGTRLSPEEADKEAAKEGFVLDHRGECGALGHSHQDRKMTA
jgi:hypothetical protein